MTISSLPSSIHPEPITARDTLAAAWRLLKMEWRPLLKLLALPCAVIALVGALVPANEHHMQDSEAIITNIIFYGLNLLLQPWLAVAAFRFLILGEAAGGWWPNYQPRMWRYLWKTITIGFVLGMPVLILGALSFAVLPQWVAAICILLLVLAASLASGRVLLALPAAAVDDGGLRLAWDKTRGQALRILTIKFLAQLTLLLPFLLSTLISFLLSQLSPLLGKLVALWMITFMQLLVLLPIDALLYGYFYRGMVVNLPENESQTPHVN